MIGSGYGRRLSKQSRLWFSIKISHLCTMTYQEAQSYLKRIREFAVGIPVKGCTIKRLFIAPTDWKEMTGFIHLGIQKGEETALIEYDNRGISLSVYGVSLLNKDFDIPRWEMINMDNWELILGN